MKKTLVILLGLCLILGGCGGKGDPAAKAETEAGSSLQSTASGEEMPENKITDVTIMDSTGAEVTVTQNPRVVCLYGSYADAWLLAGGELIGVTEDAVKDHQLDLPEDIAIIGSVKKPNAEIILSLDPDLVILSLDTAAQQDLLPLLENAGISCVSYRVDTFDDYDFMMTQFCQVTGRSDLYETNVTQPAEKIEEVKERVREAADPEKAPQVLLMRAFSTGIKAKTDDELAGVILKELGCHNIADDHPSMLEDLSLEAVILADPDYIFVTTMGSEEDALAYLDSQIEANPAWQDLTAVKEERVFVLPKALFHYKPNELWGESYEYLARILYADAFEE